MRDSWLSEKQMGDLLFSDSTRFINDVYCDECDGIILREFPIYRGYTPDFILITKKEIIPIELKINPASIKRHFQRKVL